MTLIEMRQELGKLWERAKAIKDVADTEKRAMTAEEEQNFDKAMNDFDKLQEQIRREERFQNAQPQANDPETRGASDPEQRTQIDPEQEQRALDAYLRTGNAAELRALQIGTATEGGYLLPPDWRKKLLDGVKELNIMRGMATVITSGVNRVTMPTVTSHGAAAWTAEEALFHVADEAFSDISIDVF